MITCAAFHLACPPPRRGTLTVDAAPREIRWVRFRPPPPRHTQVTRSAAQKAYLTLSGSSAQPNHLHPSRQACLFPLAWRGLYRMVRADEVSHPTMQRSFSRERAGGMDMALAALRWRRRGGVEGWCAPSVTRDRGRTDSTPFSRRALPPALLRVPGKASMALGPACRRLASRASLHPPTPPR